jgi:hypothetical protein
MFDYFAMGPIDGGAIYNVNRHVASIDNAGAVMPPCSIVGTHRHSYFTEGVKCSCKNDRAETNESFNCRRCVAVASSFQVSLLA